MGVDILSGVLLCPVCGQGLFPTSDGRSAACRGGRRHLFDFSSSGYLNLYTGNASGGDSAECIAARHAFLEKDYYRPISEGINALIEKYIKKEKFSVLDAGCGEGYYTDRMASLSGAFVYGFDLSKAGINTAAKRAKKNKRENEFFGVAGIYSLPVLTGAFDAVTSIFAPCAEEEFSRILKDDGVMILAGAGKEHLIGLKEAVYEKAYENEGRRDLPENLFSLAEKTEVIYDISLYKKEDIENLFAMTPYFYRTSARDMEKLASLDSLSTKIDVELFVYTKNRR